jgi:hypothetical protein
MSFQRPCIGAGGPCPTRALTTHSSGRCETCRRAHWNARGTTTERGYDARHRQLREAWRPLVEAGDVDCARCHEPILPGDPWDLGHTDDRTGWTGPEHRAHNRATNKKR